MQWLGKMASLEAQTVKRLPTVLETWVQSMDWEHPLEKEIATHSSTLAWKIPWMEEPGRLQSMGSQRVGHNWVTSLTREDGKPKKTKPGHCRGYADAEWWSRYGRRAVVSNRRLSRMFFRQHFQFWAFPFLPPQGYRSKVYGCLNP